MIKFVFQVYKYYILNLIAQIPKPPGSILVRQNFLFFFSFKGEGVVWTLKHHLPTKYVLIYTLLKNSFFTVMQKEFK